MATVPKPARAQRADMRGYSWRSIAYTVSTSQTVIDKAWAKPKRGVGPSTLHNKCSPCNTQATIRTRRALTAPMARAASAGTA